MELKDKLSFGAKRVDYIMEEYFNREKTLGYCKACPNYEKYWSCPPFKFDEEIFLKQFKYIHIIGRQYEIPRDDIRKIRDPKEIAAYSKEKLDAIKVMTWKTLLDIENEIEGSMGLIPGTCPICNVKGLQCARELNKPCRFPKFMRFSLESLGFNVMDLVKYEVGMTILWSENMRLPKHLTSVSAILCNEEIPKEILKKYFPDKKKSWVKYKDEQLDTGFHTTEKIKPSETLHGNETQKDEKIKVIAEEEMPQYKPRKSWLGYKAEKESEDQCVKKGWTVTIQGEDDCVVDDIIKKDVLVLEEEKFELASKTEKAAEKTAEKTAEKVETETDEETNYKWIGFKTELDDEIVKRPIPKMADLVLEGEEPDVSSKEDQDLVDDEKTILAEEKKEVEEKLDQEICVENKVQEVKQETIEEETIEEETIEEEDDSKYQWLGYKKPLDDNEEKIVTKNTLSTINVPQ